MAEMRHFGLEPALPFAPATTALELGPSFLILVGWHRRLGTLSLVLFTLGASILANRFWTVASADRIAPEDEFFEHPGLVGGLMPAALVDWRSAPARSAPRAS